MNALPAALETVADPFDNEGLYVVDSVADIDPDMVGVSQWAEVVRLREAADRTRANSRAQSTQKGYTYWVGRYEEWCTDPSQRRAQMGNVVVKPWPVDLGDLIYFLSDLTQPPPEGHPDSEEWKPPVYGTITNIVSAVKWASAQRGVKLDPTPGFEEFLEGMRRQLGEMATLYQAKALVVEQLGQIGAMLLGPGADACRDALVVVLAGLGLGPAAISRVDPVAAAELGADTSRDLGLRRLLGDVLASEPFLTCRAGRPLLDTYPQQVRQILLRCARDAGVSDGTASRRHSPTETQHIVDWLLNRVDPARLRDHALLSTGFAAALRRSELSRGTIDWLEFRDDGFIYEVRWSKNNKTPRPEWIGVPASKHVAIDADRAMRRWVDYLASVGRAKPGDPLFPGIDRHGRIADSGMTGNAIADMIRRRVLEAGVAATETQAAAYSGHSLRRGFCTSAAQRGLDALAIARQTRHKNLDHVQIYVEEALALDPKHNPAAKVLG